jgi:hypothetical protein
VEVDGETHTTKACEASTAQQQQARDREKDALAWEQGLTLVRLHHRDLLAWPGLLRAAAFLAAWPWRGRFIFYTQGCMQLVAVCRKLPSASPQVHSKRAQRASRAGRGGGDGMVRSPEFCSFQPSQPVVCCCPCRSYFLFFPTSNFLASVGGAPHQGGAGATLARPWESGAPEQRGLWCGCDSVPLQAGGWAMGVHSVFENWALLAQFLWSRPNYSASPAISQLTFGAKACTCCTCMARAVPRWHLSTPLRP